MTSSSSYNKDILFDATDAEVLGYPDEIMNHNTIGMCSEDSVPLIFLSISCQSLRRIVDRVQLNSFFMTKNSCITHFSLIIIT
jgi:hypothetical protein